MFSLIFAFILSFLSGVQLQAGNVWTASFAGFVALAHFGLVWIQLRQ